MRMLFGSMLLLALSLSVWAEDAPVKKPMPKTWEKDKPGEKVEGRWPAGTLVTPKKQPQNLTFGDWADEKEVSYKLSDRVYFSVVKDNGDGWIRIADNGRQGWVNKDALVPTLGSSKYWEKAVKADPDDAWIHVAQGFVKLLEGDSKELRIEALACYSEAIRLDPDLIQAYRLRAPLWTWKKELKKAIADLTEVIRLAPKDPQSYISRGHRWKDLEDYRKAIDDFTKAISFDAKSAYAPYGARAECWSKLEEHDKAMADYNKEIERYPTSPFAYWHRGSEWLAMREYAKAIADADEAIRLDPTNSHGFDFRADIWRTQKEFKKALADCDEAIRLEPKNPSAYETRGYIRYDMKEYDKAIADCDAALKLNPKSATAIANKGGALFKLKKPAEAFELLEKAIEFEPEAWMYRDVALFRATCPDAKFRDGKKAIEAGKLAIEKKGKGADWEYFAALAAAYAETGEFERAISEQKKAIADKHIHPTDKKEMEARLELYRAKKPFRDE